MLEIFSKVKLAFMFHLNAPSANTFISLFMEEFLHVHVTPLTFCNVFTTQVLKFSPKQTSCHHSQYLSVLLLFSAGFHHVGTMYWKYKTVTIE